MKDKADMTKHSASVESVASKSLPVVPSSHFLSEFASHNTPDGYEYEVVYKCIHCKKRCYYGEMLEGHQCEQYAAFQGFKMRRQML